MSEGDQVTQARAARRKFFEASKEFTSIVAVDGIDGAKFLVDTGDDTVGGLLFVKGRRGEFNVLEAAVAVVDALGLRSRTAGDAFLDIGANIGTTTIPALLWHSFRSAVACEPEPRNYRLLKLNAVLNNVDDRLRAIPVAVSAHVGTITLFVDPHNSGAHAVGVGSKQPNVARTREGEMTVEKVSLDYLVTRGLLEPERLGLIWIDVQGHEGHVLAGAKSLLTHGIPTVIEFHPGMLRESRGMTLLTGVTTKYFTHFVDLRQVQLQPHVSFELNEAKEMKSYAAELKESASEFTDLLLLRVKDSRLQKWTSSRSEELRPKSP